MGWGCSALFPCNFSPCILSIRMPLLSFPDVVISVAILDRIQLLVLAVFAIIPHSINLSDKAKLTSEEPFEGLITISFCPDMLVGTHPCTSSSAKELST